MNEDFSFLLPEARRGSRRQLGHSMGSFFFFFPREYKSLCFQTRFSQNAFLQNSKFKNSAKHCRIDKCATATFFFVLLLFLFISFFALHFLFLLSHPPLLLRCRKSMKYLSGRRVWKAQLYMVMLLASQITLCSGEQNNPSLGSLFFFFFFFVFPRNAVA